jgi:hypothetical protein
MIKLNNFFSITPMDLTIENYNNLKVVNLQHYIKYKLNIKIRENIMNDKLSLINIIRTKKFCLNKIKMPKYTIYNFMFKMYLYKLGNYNNKNIILSHNDQDIYTQKSIKDIPPAYIYCLNDNNEIYTFDIRTLYYMYLLDNNIRNNPYTNNIICCDTLLHIKKKIDFLQRQDINIYHLTYLKKIQSNRVNIDEIIYSLYLLDFNIDKYWIINLSFTKLKKLYNIIYNKWHYGILSENYKSKIVNTKVDLFKNYGKKYNKNELLNVIFTILYRLISEGENIEFKKIGALYFIISLTHVSKYVYDKYWFLIN